MMIMVESLIICFIFAIILFTLLRALGLQLIGESFDVKLYGKLMAAVCLGIWAIKGFGLSDLLDQVGTWLGFVGATLLIIRLNHGKSESS